ncbi:bifunctional 3-demethylubiquinol 3-O-methyltransferase/2-polyprenyl-6-hydroxyphenol methylase [Halioglobus sp. HI00S01]|uniref:bifunctional 2-polyprenyl-6-hydroxyphenol methylase/3-demethylubiquinol 3-O-methyltransferase UbiG n=1 Tax=Halioglobus sp. HI00S01 TaxID=1822214 RepID=UPI0007C3B2B3|nr:bifunctional 2-polyprenyl-6-hydroxyphenol methylase/3-demethylubiquinol 3-O-methyltransferase UbiG [Halioglobus sp. HI00S01]KZX60570.1 bifunctional 3-demethylubiquinol 3-O-methyltransferase/2-polyprenyl-6-hydroxyphenol methylase [Halioglobus sp. HI00S01]
MSTHKNVDPAEIAKFEELASRWWDRNSEFKPLHDINPLRANYIDRLSPVAGKRLVDVGCGGGILAEAMAQRGANVTGIDMGEAPLSVAKLHGLESGVEVDYFQSTAEALAENEAAAFDIVCCLEMLEHVPDPGAIIQACADMAKPGANLYFSTINRNLKAYAFAIVGAEHILRLLPAGTHEYDKFIKPSELAGWIRDAGLLLKDQTGLTYNPITQTYRLNPRDVSVNYMVHAVKPA